MAVGGYCDTMYAVDMLHEIFYLVAELPGHTISCSVRDIDNSRTGLYHSLNDSGKIFIVGTARILGIKLHILNKALGILYSRNRALDNLFAIGVELIFYMRVGSADTGMYAFMLGILQRLGGDTDVIFHSARQCTYGRPCDGL